MLRIIGGQWRSRRLQVPLESSTRPTADRVKEALFSILADRIFEARVLDLFAGSGALGLEALSRGAAQCLFVDYHPAALQALEKNLQALQAKGQILNRDLGRSDLPNQTWDLILADPPYEQGWVKIMLNKCQDRLAPYGCLVLEHSPREQPLLLPDWHLMDQRRYGRCCLSFLESIPQKETS